MVTEVDISPHEALKTAPLPIIDNKHKFILNWSAKSASKAALKWYYSIIGVLKDADRHSTNYHYYKSRLANQVIIGRLDEYRLLKIVRDPMERAVSSYKHHLKYERFHKEIENVLNLNIIDDGLSFKEFIDFLITQNIEKTDIHRMQQYHKIERLMKDIYRINISRNSMHDELNQYSIRYSMPIAQIETTRSVEVSVHDSDCYENRFKPSEVDLIKVNSLLVNKARERLRLIYSKDIAMYGEI